MRVSERLALNRSIAAQISARFDWVEVDSFLSAFGLKVGSAEWSDKEGYVRSALGDADLSVLSEIIEDLGLSAFSEAAPERQLPEHWKNTQNLRVFISHSSKEKAKATRLRESMKTQSMSAFVAHDDIEPTLEWQVQIERALHSMELFVSLHTQGFKDSVWTQQEIGFAVAKGVKIIPVRFGEDPTGFIQKNQALSRGEKKAEELTAAIVDLVEKDERLRDRYVAAVEADLDSDLPF